MTKNREIRLVGIFMTYLRAGVWRGLAAHWNHDSNRPSVRGGDERECRFVDLRREVPVGQMGPELRLSRRILVGDHDAERHGLIAFRDPNLKVHLLGAGRKVLDVLASQGLIVHQRYVADPLFEFLRQGRHEQQGQRNRCLQPFYDIVENLIDGPWLFQAGIEWLTRRDHRYGLAIEPDLLRGAVAPFEIDAKVVGAAQEDVAHLAEFYLLSGCLHDVVAGVDGHGEGFCLGKVVGHAHENCVGIHLLRGRFDRWRRWRRGRRLRGRRVLDDDCYKAGKQNDGGPFHHRTSLGGRTIFGRTFDIWIALIIVRNAN